MPPLVPQLFWPPRQDTTTPPHNQVCCHIPIHIIWRCLHSLYYMYDKNVECSLKGSTASSLKHSIVAWSSQWHLSQLSKIWRNVCGGNAVWVCCHMPIHNCVRYSNTLCMYAMDVGCSLKSSMVSTTASWHGHHTYITKNNDFSPPSPIYGEMSVVVTVWGMCCHMPIHNCLRCSNTLHMYDIDVGCSLKGSTASTIA